MRSGRRRFLGASIVLLLSVQALVAIHARAQGPQTQAIPTATWSITPDSLSAVGVYFAALKVPSPQAGQSAENAWQHALVFRFTGSSSPFGLVSLDTDGTGKYATIAVNDGAGAVSAQRFTFDWFANTYYFLLAVQLPGGGIAGFVYEVITGTVTFIGAVRGQAAWGPLSGTATTLVRWYGTDQDDCAAYPLTDTFFSTPYGFVAGDSAPHPATPVGDFVTSGDCPATVTGEPEPTTFRHLVAGSLSGPATTTSSTTTSSTTTAT